MVIKAGVGGEGVEGAASEAHSSTGGMGNTPTVHNWGKRDNLNFRASQN